MQIAVNTVEQWSSINKLQLNPDKCKELIIDFKKAKHQFDAVTVNSIDLERVDSVKVLGVTITSTLQWNCHISDVIKKANKRMYFLILLKRAKVPAHDICFYLTCIRPVLEYCAPLYHHALPDYLCKDIERIQKRALSIISPGLSYCDNLSMFNMDSLKGRRIEQCNKFFESIVLYLIQSISCTTFYLPRTIVPIISEDSASLQILSRIPSVFLVHFCHQCAGDRSL